MNNSTPKNVEEMPGLSIKERQEIQVKKKKDAIKKAEDSEKNRFKSSSSKIGFIEFLECRLKIWECEKDKTFHGKRMYEKTKTILNSLSEL